MKLVIQKRKPVVNLLRKKSVGESKKTPRNAVGNGFELGDLHEVNLFIISINCRMGFHAIEIGRCVE